MHVTIQRTGGFAGIPFTKELDADSLPQDEANRLRQMVETADFFRLPSVIPFAPQPDRFQYQIIIEQGGKKHRVTVNEAAIPFELKPLLNWLLERGPHSPKSSE
ncbi:MAG: protealysin inhibitor emfourin [Gammaproteobacteria bacterium]